MRPSYGSPSRPCAARSSTAALPRGQRFRGAAGSEALGRRAPARSSRASPCAGRCATPAPRRLPGARRRRERRDGGARRRRAAAAHERQRRAVMSVAVAAPRRHSGLLLGVMGVDPSSPMMAPHRSTCARPGVPRRGDAHGRGRLPRLRRHALARARGPRGGAINLVLDPFLMFNRGMGIKGAAAAATSPSTPPRSSR